MKNIILKVGVVLSVFAFMSCATLHERCTQNDEWKRYGSYNQCMSEKKAEDESTARAISAASEEFQKGYDSQNQNKSYSTSCKTDRFGTTNCNTYSY